MTLLTIKATLLCLSVYSAPVRLLQPLMICATVSASRILHSVVDLVCHCPGAEGLLLSCHDQSLGVSSDVAFIEPLARLQLHLAFSRWLWTACIRLSANQYFRCWADPFLLSFCWCIVQLGLTWDRTHHAWSWASLFLCQFIKVYRRWVLDEWNSESVNCSHLVFAGELALQNTSHSISALGSGLATYLFIVVAKWLQDFKTFMATDWSISNWCFDSLIPPPMPLWAIYMNLSTWTPILYAR